MKKLINILSKLIINLGIFINIHYIDKTLNILSLLKNFKEDIIIKKLIDKLDFTFDKELIDILSKLDETQLLGVLNILFEYPQDTDFYNEFINKISKKNEYEKNQLIHSLLDIYYKKSDSSSKSYTPLKRHSMPSMPFRMPSRLSSSLKKNNLEIVPTDRRSI